MQLREDAGVSQRRLALAAGVSRAHLGAIEAGEAEPSIEVLGRIGAALGADLSVRFFEGTGPRLRDHLQTPMANELLAQSRAAWAGRVEVVVTRPVRGVIDVVLDEREGATTVAAEIHSQLRRIEQQIRWQHQKTEALAELDELAGRHVSQLLVLRNTAALRAAVRGAAGVMAAAYPARAVDAVAALRGEGAWPGAAIVWMNVELGIASLIDGPPRGVSVGRSSVSARDRPPAAAT